MDGSVSGAGLLLPAKLPGPIRRYTHGNKLYLINASIYRPDMQAFIDKGIENINGLAAADIHQNNSGCGE